MKKLLFVMIGMPVVCLHGATLDETRRILREAIEVNSTPSAPDYMERWKQIVPELNALDRSDKQTVLSVYFEILAKKFDDPGTVSHIMWRFRELDSDITLQGNREALDWAQRVVREKGNKFGIQTAGRYLVQKGDTRDLDVLSPLGYGSDLAKRVAGTNLVNTRHGPDSMPNLWNGITPSVTNVGPQALYAQEILRQYWEQMEGKITEFFGETITSKYQSQIPAELQAIVVWFDDDGEPVCNVDLSKYGLSMPVLDVPNRPKPKPKAGGAMPSPASRDEPTVATPPPPLPGETSGEAAASTPPGRLWLSVAGGLLCACTVFYFMRKKPQN